jgi:hypothetical protein
MPDRILIVERDPTDDTVWRYGIADAAGQLGTTYRLRLDPAAGFVPLDGQNSNGLWPTVILLVRRSGHRTRIVYDLTIRPVDAAPEPPPRPPGARWERATAGKSKGPGETLSERAERDRHDRPRAVA